MKIKLTNKLLLSLLFTSISLVSAQTRTAAKKEIEHWITIGADALPGLQKQFGNLMKKMDDKDIIINRKVLADIAVNNSDDFVKVVKHAIS